MTEHCGECGSRKCNHGNSVPPVMSEALVRANVVEQAEEQAA